MSEVDGEVAEGVGSPAIRRGHEAEAGGVYQGHDRHGHAAVGQIDTADATIELNEDAEEVLVGDPLSVRGSLNTSHHELVLWRDRLLDSILFLRNGDIVSELGQV